MTDKIDLPKNKTVACYCRVSTENQNLERQIHSTTEFAQDRLGVSLEEIDVFRDKSTGTNTKRDGYRNMMRGIEDGQIVAVVVHEISRIARSVQDLERTVSRITDADAEIHFVRDNLAFGGQKEDPMHRLQMQMLGAFSEWEAAVKQQNTREGIAARKRNDSYHHGPAPLGYQKDDGELLPTSNHDRVCAVLDMVQKGELSKRKAARELETSRKTINRCLQKGDLYGL